MPNVCQCLVQSSKTRKGAALGPKSWRLLAGFAKLGKRTTKVEANPARSATIAKDSANFGLISTKLLRNGQL